MTVPITALSTAPRSLVLRSATPADAVLIADMHARSRASAYRGLLPDDYLDHQLQADSMAEWLAMMPVLANGGGQVLIAESAGLPIGFVCMMKPDEEGNVYIYALHALPEHKRSGAGTTMLAAAQAWATDERASSLHLLVLEANVAAIGFYESRGWRLAGRKDDRMGGIDLVALRYVLPLKPAGDTAEKR